MMGGWGGQAGLERGNEPVWANRTANRRGQTSGEEMRISPINRDSKASRMRARGWRCRFLHPIALGRARRGRSAMGAGRPPLPMLAAPAPQEGVVIKNEWSRRLQRVRIVQEPRLMGDIRILSEL